MQLYFLKHSGFLLENHDYQFIFDVIEDPAQVLTQPNRMGKPRLYFVSHAHHDHLDLNILEKLQKDDALILEKGAWQKLLESLNAEQSKSLPRKSILLVEAGKTYTEQESLLAKFGLRELFCGDSTDEGVSFTLLTQQGEVFYHAGDLNVWNWQDEPLQEDGLFESQARYIQFINAHFQKLEQWQKQHLLKRFDWACIPLDARLEETAVEGMLFWARRFRQIKNLNLFSPLLIPMHHHDGITLPEKVQALFNAENLALDVSPILKEGQSLEN